MGPEERRDSVEETERESWKTEVILDQSIPEAHSPWNPRTGKKCSHDRQTRGEIHSDAFWHQPAVRYEIICPGMK